MNLSILKSDKKNLNSFVATGSALVFIGLTTHRSDYSGRHVEYEFDIVCCTFIPVFIFLRNVLEMHSQFVQHRYLLEET